MFHYNPSASVEEMRPWKQTAFCILLNIHRTFSKMQTFLTWLYVTKGTLQKQWAKREGKPAMSQSTTKKNKLKTQLDFQNRFHLQG